MRHTLCAIIVLTGLGMAGAAWAIQESPPAPEDLRFTKRDSTVVTEKAIGTPYWMLQAQCAGTFGAAAAWNQSQGKSADAARDTSHGVAFYNDAVSRLMTDRKIDKESAEEIAQQTLAMTGDPASGYAGTVTIAVDLTAERSTGGMMAPPDGMGPGGEPPALPNG